MWIVGTFGGTLLIIFTLIDAFETILQPRRVTHRFRYARFFYRNAWKLWRAIALKCFAGKKRESFLGIFGPLSLLTLFITWVILLVFGFAVMHWSLNTQLRTEDKLIDFGTDLYLSGTTFFTLGFGDVTPVTHVGRVLAVIESGLGFGFLAIVIGYLPVLSQAFSRREVTISLLDARAGSPPSAAEFLIRLARAGNFAAVDAFLAEWELWSAELLESHLSLPILCYYRSQHDNQSWVASLTMMLDVCAILIAEEKSSLSYRAQLAFAMARHAAVDLSVVLKAGPCKAEKNRLTSEQRQQLEHTLRAAGLELLINPDIDARLSELRGMYEPFVEALARRFLFMLPPVVPAESVADNWQRAPGMPRTPGIGSLPAARAEGEHFG